MTTHPDILNEEQAAALLDCEPSTVQERARRQELPAVKFGRSWRFPRAALVEYINALAMANLRRAAPAARGVGRVQRKPPTLPTLT